MSAFRFRFKQAGAHTHVRVFAGNGLGSTLGKCGDLTFRNEEWEEFRKALGAGGMARDVAIEIVPDGDDHGDRH